MGVARIWHWLGVGTIADRGRSLSAHQRVLNHHEETISGLLAENERLAGKVRRLDALERLVRLHRIQAQINALQESAGPVRLPETEDGAKKIANDTTPTCASTESGSVKAGDVCPTCGRRSRPLSNAERQRRFREKMRGA